MFLNSGFCYWLLYQLFKFHFFYFLFNASGVDVFQLIVVFKYGFPGLFIVVANDSMSFRSLARSGR